MYLYEKHSKEHHEDIIYSCNKFKQGTIHLINHCHLWLLTLSTFTDQVLCSTPSWESTQEHSQPNLGQCGLKARENRAVQPTGVRHSTTRRAFQGVGPATEKTRRCRKAVRVCRRVQ